MLKTSTGEIVWYLANVPREMAEVLSFDGTNVTVRLLTGPQKGLTISSSLELFEDRVGRLTPQELEKVRECERINQVCRKLDRN